MDQLFTVDEMMSFFKVSRGTIYNFMKDGVLPYVEIRGQRRFIGSQVMKALKDMQTKQAQSRVRGDSSVVLEDTLSDVHRRLSSLSLNCNKGLEKIQKCPDKKRVSNNVKRARSK